MLIILAVIMLVLLMMGYPMMVPLAVGTLFMMFTGLTFFGPDQAITWMVNGVGSWVLAAVPMFIFAADILTKGHTANRLLDVVDAFTPASARRFAHYDGHVLRGVWRGIRFHPGHGGGHGWSHAATSAGQGLFR